MRRDLNKIEVLVGRARRTGMLSKAVFAVGFVVFGFLSYAEGRALPESARLVPPETVLLVEVDNFSQLRKQFEKTDLYKWYKEPAMAAFFSSAKSKVREEFKKQEDPVGDAVFNADVLPEGRVALALVLDEKVKDSNEPQLLLISQWGANLDKIKEAVSKAVKKAVEADSREKMENYRGVRIKTLIDKDKSEGVSYCFADDNLVVSENPEVLKFAIAHMQGASSPTLASSSDYTGGMRAVGPHHDFDFYVNIKQIIKATLSKDTTGKSRTTIMNLGFDNVSSVCGSLGVGRVAGSSYNGKVSLKVNGAKKGVCKILEMESAALRVPKFVSRSTYSLTFLNLNIKKAYAELARVLHSFGPMYAAILYTPLLPPSPDGQPGLEIKTGIIDHLGAQIIIAQSVNKGVSEGKRPAESLVAIAASNPRELEKSLSVVHSTLIAPNKPEAKRELLGHTIYQVRFPGFPMFGGGKQPMQGPVGGAAVPMPKFAFSFADGYLIMGLESTVEKAIRTRNSSGASLASARWFGMAKSHIPSVVGMACMEDSAALGEFFWETLKKSRPKGADGDESRSLGISVSPGSGMMLAHSGLNIFDFSLLPKFEVVRKYFGLSTLYGISKPNGYFFEFRDVSQRESN